MGKTLVATSFDKARIQGVAQLSQSQIETLTFERNLTLKEGITYVIPAQKAHKFTLPREFNGVKYSVKIFAIACKDGVPTECLSIGLMQFTSTFYFKREDKVDIPVRYDYAKKVFRAAVGTPLIPVFNAELPKKINEDKSCFITETFAFKVAERCVVCVGDYYKEKETDSVFKLRVTDDQKFVAPKEINSNILEKVEVPDIDCKGIMKDRDLDMFLL